VDMRSSVLGVGIFIRFRPICGNKMGTKGMGDERTVREYLNNLNEAKDGSPIDFTRNIIIGYLNNAIEQGIIRKDDKVNVALEKMRKEFDLPKRD